VVWGGFYAVTYVEGFGSIFLLLCAWGALRAGANPPELENSSLGIAFLLVFFALMGIAFDQPGNFIYNKPVEWIFCPSGTELTREVLSRSVRGGGVSLSQNFRCVADDGQVLHVIGGFEHILFRFFEYVLLGYVLLGLSRFYTKIKSAGKSGETV
jgi:hypothetical protein